MKTYVFFEQKTGRILESMVGSYEAALAHAALLGSSVYVPSAGEECPWDENFYIDIKNSKVKVKPTQPSPAHFFDYNSKSWQIDIVEYREYVWGCIKHYYTDIINEGFSWRGHVFDFDEKSQAAITQAAQMASIDATRAFNWTLKDNTILALDSAEMVEVSKAMVDKLQEMHDEKQQLREQVNATYREQVLKDLIPQEK